jgi:hypothetical protein
MMKKTIVPLTKKEKEIVERVTSTLSSLGMKSVVEAIEVNVQALKDLALSISQYPSIFHQQRLGKNSRSVKTLIENLCITDISDLIYHIPTKALLGQGFAVAKINFFFMMLYSIQQTDTLQNYYEKIQSIIQKNVYTSMGEEVFLSIISDKNIQLEVRTRAGLRLANIWEYRLDHGVKEFAPILNNIWTSRKNMQPIFGTMLGITEFFHMSHDSGDVWLDFFHRDDLRHEEIDSLHEFLMGLSFEERESISKEMERTGQSTFCEEDVRSFLGETRMYTEYNIDDPREIFRSFKQRKRNAEFRKRADLEGPKKTIEEYLMMYLLSLDEEVVLDQFEKEYD